MFFLKSKSVGYVALVAIIWVTGLVHYYSVRALQFAWWPITWIWSKMQLLDDSDRVHEYTSWWRHNGRDSVSNHQPHGCLLNRLFRRRSKKTSKLRVTGLCVGNSTGTGEFPAQMARNAENVSIWWRHYVVTAMSARWHASLDTRMGAKVEFPSCQNDVMDAISVFYFFRYRFATVPLNYLWKSWLRHCTYFLWEAVTFHIIK